MKMASKETENQQWSDPKDFGLPFVEVKPISKKTELPTDQPKEKPVTKEKSKVKSIDPANGKQEVKEEKQPEIQSAKDAPVNPALLENGNKKPVSSRPELPASKSTNTWAWIVIFLALAVVSVIVWQLMGGSTVESENTTESESVELEAKEVTPSQETTANLVTADTSQNAINQDSIAVTQDSNLNISKPVESGTTIANTAPGSLIRIDSKGPKTRYFIIVSSLPNEKLALEVAGGFAKRSQELYLISPYENSPNYRVAIASFDSWNSASKEMARIKSEYTEDLWILNY